MNSQKEQSASKEKTKTEEPELPKLEEKKARLWAERIALKQMRLNKKILANAATQEEIKEDIQTARDIADEIKALSFRLGAGGKVSDEVVSQILHGQGFSSSYQSMALWLYFGTGACFL